MGLERKEIKTDNNEETHQIRSQNTGCWSPVTARCLQGWPSFIEPCQAVSLPQHQCLSPLVKTPYLLPHRNGLPASCHLHFQGQKDHSSLLPWLVFSSESNLCVFSLQWFITGCSGAPPELDPPVWILALGVLYDFGKLLHCFMPQFLHLSNRDNKSPIHSIVRVWWVNIETMTGT